MGCRVISKGGASGLATEEAGKTNVSGPDEIGGLGAGAGGETAAGGA